MRHALGRLRPRNGVDASEGADAVLVTMRFGVTKAGHAHVPARCTSDGKRGASGEGVCHRDQARRRRSLQTQVTLPWITGWRRKSGDRAIDPDDRLGSAHRTEW